MPSIMLRDVDLQAARGRLLDLRFRLFSCGLPRRYDGCAMRRYHPRNCRPTLGWRR